MLLWILFSILTLIGAEIESFRPKKSSINKYPHTAILNVASIISDHDNKLHSWMCGASILNQKMVVTAANCVYRCRPESHVTIIMGQTDDDPGVSIPADGIVFHEHFDPVTKYCDIALVKLATAVVLNRKFCRVAVMKKPPYSELAHLAGWGLIKEGTKNNLREVGQIVWMRSHCLKSFNNSLPLGTFCANSKKRALLASTGDSGSGLVVRSYILIGLVSYRTPREEDDIIVYTNVSYHYEWVAINAHRLYCASNNSDGGDGYIRLL